MKYNFISLLNDRQNKIIYDKNLRQITWSITSAILLQQMIYWSERKKWQEFYKFRTKCSHPLYEEGDSWCEELWFDEYEFDTALKNIWYKLWKTKNKISKKNALIIYRYSKEKLTYYNLNKEVLNDKLSTLLEFQNLELYKNDKISDSNSVLKNETLIITETTTETTTENLKNNKKDLENIYQDYYSYAIYIEAKHRNKTRSIKLLQKAIENVWIENVKLAIKNYQQTEEVKYIRSLDKFLNLNWKKEWAYYEDFIDIEKEEDINEIDYNKISEEKFRILIEKNGRGIVKNVLRPIFTDLLEEQQQMMKRVFKEIIEKEVKEISNYYFT